MDYLKNYENDLFDFAFSAERSIEDGIAELSEAETPTVIISYVVMFIYVTIALGKFKGVRDLFVSTKSPNQSPALGSKVYWVFFITFTASSLDGE